MRGVELVEHPGGGLGARQEVARLGDQVGEIEHARPPLGRVIGLQDGVADDEQRLGRGKGAGEPQAVARGASSALRLGGETLAQARLRSAEGGAEALRRDCGPSSRPILVVGQEERQARAPPPRSGSGEPAISLQRRLRLAVVAVVRGGKASPSASRQRCRNPHASSPPRRRSRGRPPLRSRPGARPSRARRSASASSMPPPRLRRAQLDPAADRLALCDHRIERLADLRVVGVLGQVAHRRAQAASPARAAASVHHLARAPRAISAAAGVSSRMANWPGTFASKGNWCSSRSQKAWIVWIFSPPGVSSARAKSRRAWRSSAARRRRGPAASAISALSSVVRQRRPLAERAEDAARHLGGRDLGEGQAEDRRRIGAGEEQADHALRQHMRLAGAGIGDHPGGSGRVGRLAAGCRACGRNRADAHRARRPRPSRRPPTIRRRARDGRSRRRRRARASGSFATGIPPPASAKWATSACSRRLGRARALPAASRPASPLSRGADAAVMQTRRPRRARRGGSSRAAPRLRRRDPLEAAAPGDQRLERQLRRQRQHLVDRRRRAGLVVDDGETCRRRAGRGDRRGRSARSPA